MVKYLKIEQIPLQPDEVFPHFCSSWCTHCYVEVAADGRYCEHLFALYLSMQNVIDSEMDIFLSVRL